jgi:hypothetical protein
MYLKVNWGLNLEKDSTTTKRSDVFLSAGLEDD